MNGRKKGKVEVKDEEMVSMMERIEKNYMEGLNKSWVKMKKREITEKYVSEDFEKKKMLDEGKRVLDELMKVKKSVGDFKVVIMSEMGKNKVRCFLVNNGYGEEIEVGVCKEGKFEDLLVERGMKKEDYGKVLVLSRSEKDMEECKGLGISFDCCDFNKDVLEEKDIYVKIGLRRLT